MSPTSYRCSIPRRLSLSASSHQHSGVYAIALPEAGRLIAESSTSVALALAYFPGGLPTRVSSALRRFTSVFGMGTGGATPLKTPGPELRFVILSEAKDPAPLVEARIPRRYRSSNDMRKSICARRGGSGLHSAVRNPDFAFACLGSILLARQGAQRGV